MDDSTVAPAEATSLWEEIEHLSDHNRTERMKVPGGWLVCRTSGVHLPHSMANWFVEDPDHTWSPHAG